MILCFMKALKTGEGESPLDMKRTRIPGRNFKRKIQKKISKGDIKAMLLLNVFAPCEV